MSAYFEFLHPQTEDERRAYAMLTADALGQHRHLHTYSHGIRDFFERFLATNSDLIPANVLQECKAHVDVAINQKLEHERLLMGPKEKALVYREKKDLAEGASDDEGAAKAVEQEIFTEEELRAREEKEAKEAEEERARLEEQARKEFEEEERRKRNSEELEQKRRTEVEQDISKLPGAQLLRRDDDLEWGAPLGGKGKGKGGKKGKK